jgi:hypothetical protein
VRTLRFLLALSVLATHSPGGRLAGAELLRFGSLVAAGNGAVGSIVTIPICQHPDGS